MSATKEIFDTAIIDANFFIALAETGFDKTLLPILGDTKRIGVHCIMPDELPKTDIPKKFRDLRQALPEHITSRKVDRSAEFWKWTAKTATKRHYIRAADDPADIDVVVLARLLEKKEGKKVVVVSNDEGVLKTVQEVTEFQTLANMTAGAFLFTLSALTKDEKLQGLFTEAADKLYEQFLRYRRKSRRFVDIKSLVSELRDTSNYVRKAALAHQSEDVQKIALDESESAVHVPQLADIEGAFGVVKQLREYRETHNMIGGEEYCYTLQEMVSQFLMESKTSEDYRIIVSMVVGELYTFKTWALEVRLKTGGVFEAALHAETILSLMMFMRVSKELVEDVVALLSLLFLLNGRHQRALSLAQQNIPVEAEMSSPQLMALICARVAQPFEDDLGEAQRLFTEYALGSGSVELEGLVESIGRFANTCFLFNHNELAVKLNALVVLLCAENDPDLVQDVARRLWVLSRLNPAVITNQPAFKVVAKILPTLLPGDDLRDNSTSKVPPTWKKPRQITDAEGEIFQGHVSILDQRVPFDKPNELHVVGFEDNTRSVWRFVFPADYRPSLVEAIGFRLKGGQITKVLSKTITDPENLRGTVLVESPAIQVDMQVHW